MACFDLLQGGRKGKGYEKKYGKMGKILPQNIPKLMTLPRYNQKRPFLEPIPRSLFSQRYSQPGVQTCVALDCVPSVFLAFLAAWKLEREQRESTRRAEGNAGGSVASEFFASTFFGLAPVCARPGCGKSASYGEWRGGRGSLCSSYGCPFDQHPHHMIGHFFSLPELPNLIQK